MAVRLYLTSNAAAVSPAYSPSTGVSPPVSGWENTSSAVRGAASFTLPGGTSEELSASETSTSNVFDVLLGQWVSPPMTASGDVSGTYTWIYTRRQTVDAQLRGRMTVKVVSGNGATVRGYLANTGTGVDWTITDDSADNFGSPTLIDDDPVTGDPLVAQVGDRIVIEVGYRAGNALATSYTGFVRRGGSIPLDRDAPIEACPWVEFADLDALFAAEVDGTATAQLGSLSASALGDRLTAGTASAVLGALTAQALGTVTAEVVPGTASAQLGSLSAQATGSGLVPTITGAGQAQLGGLTAQALADVLVPALAAAQLGGLLASTSGTRTRHGLAQAVLGPLVAAAVVTPPVAYAEMRPALVLAPATTGAVRSGPTMRSA